MQCLACYGARLAEERYFKLVTLEPFLDNIIATVDRGSHYTYVSYFKSLWTVAFAAWHVA